MVSRDSEKKPDLRCPTCDRAFKASNPGPYWLHRRACERKKDEVGVTFSLVTEEHSVFGDNCRRQGKDMKTVLRELVEGFNEACAEELEEARNQR